MDISVTTIEMADTTIVGNGDLTLSSNIENGIHGTGPSANSPLIGGYLLIIIDEPHSQEHKDLILQKVAKGLLSWNKEQNLVNLEKELDIITTKAAEGEVSRLNERLIQYASENLVTEILINATSNTVLQCIRNLLSSFTRHRHIIHAGYTFAGSGSWILQDGTFSYADMCDALQDTEVQRVFEAYENIVTIDIHCSPEGEWPKLDHEQFVRMCKLKTNPTDVLTAGTPAITNFMKYIEPYVIPMETDTLLESSDVVGNIRFSHPTLYIFPGGQGDSALFGINGFNMLIDGGFARKACFWDFTRHLDRLDAVLITRINNNNINGITAVLEKKRNQQVYPQIGHVFCNLQDRRKLLSPSEDKEKDPLLIDLIEKSQQLVNCLQHINLRPQSCFRDTEPINLYHKVGHGTLNMYVLSPAKDSREVREFMEKWNANDNKVFITRKDSKELIFPIQNMISICALLIWEPAKPNENITRILFPGSTPQHKIFEGLDKLKHLEFFKTPICSANTIVPSKSLTALTKMTKPVKSLDKVIQNDNLKPLKLATDIKKEKPSPPIIDNKQRSENKAIDENKTKSITVDNKTKSTTSTMKYPTKKPLKSNVKKSESVDSSDKDEVKTDEIKFKETDSETESKKLDEDKKVTKDDKKSSVSKTRSKSKTSKSVERKPRTEIKSDTKPSTPKKVANEQQGISNKFQAKSSPSATPAKSAKDANNRKVVESKYKSLYSKKEPAKPIDKDQPPKIERKPISRRPKPPSPMRKLGGSPVKSLKLNKNEKDTRKIKNEKRDTLDSSTASTPVDIDSSKLANEVKLSETELELLKAQELADLKEEQEVIKEIEAVFSKDEKNKKTEIESATIPVSSIPDEIDEYLIIEKEEFVEYSQDAPLDNGKTETTDISEEPVEKLKEIEPITQGPSRPTEFTTPIVSTTTSKPISRESCNKIESELNEIIQSATDIVKTKEEGPSYDNDKKEKIEEISRDVSITSPEEKLELSSEKKTTDTKDIDEVENKEADQNYVVESQPDEKFSATSGATTAPTLPEDERITLDEIKEDKVPDIEEKYINEETKEKELPISIEPIRFEPKPKETDVRAMQYEAQQAHLRDIVKTPDEVADLPVHEEVDGGPYDHTHVEEQPEKDKQIDVELDTDAKQNDEDQVALTFEHDIAKDKAQNEAQIEELEQNEKQVSIDLVIAKKELKVSTDSSFEIQNKDKRDIIKETTDIPDAKSVHEVEKIPTGEQQLSNVDAEEKTREDKNKQNEIKISGVQGEKDIHGKKLEEETQEAIKEVLEQIDLHKESSVEIAKSEEETKIIDKKLEETQEVIKETIEHQGIDNKSKVEISKFGVETSILDKKLEEETQKLASLSKRTSEKMSKEEVDSDIHKNVEVDFDSTKKAISKDTLDNIEHHDDKEKLQKQSDIVLDGAEKSDPIPDSKSCLSNLDEAKDEEIDHIYTMKETWIRDKNESDELRYSGIPTEFKEPFSSMPYTVNEYTTELRETHITTLDSPKPIEDNLECTIINNKQSKLSTLLENSKELMESTSKIISDIKAKDSSKSELPSSTLGIDVVKLVANVAEVLKSDKSLEEIASTIQKDADDSMQAEDVTIANIKQLDNEGTKTISPEPEKDEKIETIPSEKCIKESILNFLNEERKAFDEVEDLGENGELEEEKDYDTEKHTSKIKKNEEDTMDSKYFSQPIKKIDILDSEVSLPIIQGVVASEIQEISKLQSIDIKDGSSKLETLNNEEQSIQEIQVGEKSITDLSVQETSITQIAEHTLTDAGASVNENDEKQKPLGDNVREKSKSPTPTDSITGVEISTKEIERPKSIIQEKSRSSTPEKLDKKDSSIDESETKESSKSPTSEVSIIDVKITNEEAKKQKLMEDNAESEVSKLSTLEKSIADVKLLTEEFIHDSKASEKSKSPTPERSIVDQKHILEIADKQKSISEFETEITHSTISEKFDETSEKQICEESEKRKSIIESDFHEKSKSPSPEKSDTKEKVTTDMDETSPKEKSPTPEKLSTDDKRSSISESIVPELSKSKSPTPEKSMEEKQMSEEPEKQKSIIESDMYDNAKSPSPEKPDTTEKVKTEIEEMSPTTVTLAFDDKRLSITESAAIELPKSKSPTPEKLVDEKQLSEEQEKVKSIIESDFHEKSKSPSPEKSDTKENVTTDMDEKLPKSKSPTPEKLSTDDKRSSIGESTVPEISKSKSPTPEKSIDEKQLSEEPEKRKSIIESDLYEEQEKRKSLIESDLYGKIKSPSPEKSDTKEKITTDIDEKSKSPKHEELSTDDKRLSIGESTAPELPKSKSPTPEKSMDEKQISEEPEKRKSIIESDFHDNAKLPSLEKADITEQITTEIDAKLPKSKSAIPETTTNDDKHTLTDQSDVQELTKAKSLTPEKLIDEKQSSEEHENRKSIIESDLHDQTKSPSPEKSDTMEKVILETGEKSPKSKSPTPEKFSTDDKRSSIGESTIQELPKSKSPTPEKSMDEKQISIEPEKRKSIIEADLQDEIESPSLEKSDTMEKETIEIDEKSPKSKSPSPEKLPADIKRSSIGESTIQELPKSKSPTPEKSMDEKQISIEPEKRKSIIEADLQDKIESPTPEKSDTMEKETIEIDEKSSKSKSPTPENFSTDDKRSSIGESTIQELPKSKSPTPEKLSTDDKRSSIEESTIQTLPKSKSPTPEKSMDEKEIPIEPEKRKSIIEADLQDKIKFPSPEKSDTIQKETIEIDEKSLKSKSPTPEKMSDNDKRSSIGESTIQELPKSKSPTPEKLSADDKRLSIGESTIQELPKSKSPTPEKSMDEKQISIEPEKRKSIIEADLQDKIKSPSPEKSDTMEKETIEIDEKSPKSKSPTPENFSTDDKRSSIGESTIQELPKSKSPTPEKFSTDDKRSSIGESTIQELPKSKSPTPEKSMDEKQISIEPEKRKSIIEADLQDEIESPSLEKSDTMEKETIEIDEKSPKSKSPTPEKLSTDDKRSSIGEFTIQELPKSKSPTPEKLSADDKRSSIGDSTIQELPKSKSPTPEKSIDEKQISIEPEKRKSIIEADLQDKIKSPSPEKSDTMEKETIEIDEKSPKSKSPTPENFSTDDKRSSIGESPIQELPKSKSPTPEKLSTDDKRSSIGESTIQALPKSKSPTPEKSMDEKEIPIEPERRKSIIETDLHYKIKSPSPEKSDTMEKETTKIDEKSPKSKSPTPDKSTKDDKQPSIEESSVIELPTSKSLTQEKWSDEKQKSIIEADLHDKIKFTSPEKSDTMEKVRTEIESPKSMSPTPEKSTVEDVTKSRSLTPEKLTEEKQILEESEKRKSIIESDLQDKTKSPSLDKTETLEKEAIEIDEKKSKSPSPEKKSPIEESAAIELSNTKSLTPEESLDEKQISKQPEEPKKFDTKSPEKSYTMGEVTTKIDEISSKSKSPTPEKLTTENKRPSIVESVQEIPKSKSPTPEQSIDEKQIFEEPEKRKSIIESDLIDKTKSFPEKFEPMEKLTKEIDDKSSKSKSPTPEKTTTDDKQPSIEESAVQELPKSKSPTPETLSIQKQLCEEQKLIIESDLQDKTKSPPTEGSNIIGKVTTETDEKSRKSKSPTPEKLTADDKRSSIGESTIKELPKSKSPTPEKSMDGKQISVESEKRKSIIDSDLHDKIKSPSTEKSDTTTTESSDIVTTEIEEKSTISKSASPEKPIVEDYQISEERSITESTSPFPEKSDFKEKLNIGNEQMTEKKHIGESEILKLPKSSTPEGKSIKESTVHDQSKSPSPEKMDTKEKETIIKDEKCQSVDEFITEKLSKSESQTSEKLIIDEKQISDASEKRIITESNLLDQSKSPFPEKLDYKEKAITEVDDKGQTFEEPAVHELEYLEKRKSIIESTEHEDSKSPLIEKAVSKEEVKPQTEEKQLISESKEKSKSPALEISIGDKSEYETHKKLETVTEKYQESTKISKPPSSEECICEEKIASDTQEKQLSTAELPARKDSITELITCEKSLLEKTVAEEIIVCKTEEKHNLIGIETQTPIENVITKTQETITQSIDKDSTMFGKAQIATESKDKSLTEKINIDELESLTNGNQTTVKKENGFDSTRVSDSFEEISNIDKQESVKFQAQTSTGSDFKSSAEKLEKEITYGMKIVTNGVEVNLEKSTSSKSVAMNGDSESDNAAKSIKTDDATISTSYSKTIDTKEIEILHTTNGFSDIHQTSEIISAEKTEKFSITDPKIVTNGSVTESSTKVAQPHDKKETKSLIEEKIPNISVDSPVKSSKIHTQSETNEDDETHEEGCLSTENLSPLHLSGRSTPEIKIDLDVDRQSEKEMLPLEDIDKAEDLVVGTSSTKTDIGVTSVIRQSTEDISGNLSGKSTPDIAEVEKLKEELKFEKYISKKSTSPKHSASTIIKDSETICVMKASKITTEKHEVLTESTGKVIKEEIITTEEQSIERGPDLKLDKDSQHEITIETNTKIIKTVSEETHDVQTNGKSEQFHDISYQSKVLENNAEPLTLYKTSGESDIGEVSSPPSNLSSGQASCAARIWDEHFTDEEDLPESPLSTTSQMGGSPTSQFQYDAGLNEDTILFSKQMDTMSTSFYGSLPDEKITDHSKTEPVLIPKKSEHFGSSSMSETQTFIELGTGISKHEFLSSDIKSKINIEKDELTSRPKDETEHKITKDDKSTDDKLNTGAKKLDKSDSQADGRELKEQEEIPNSSSKSDSVQSWGKPLGLPSPAPPGDTKSTPKKERKTAASILAVKNKKNNERKRSESPGKLNKKINPVYLDLTYVPHHGNANYCYVDFFKKIRARYYVFSGTEPSREVYNALLEAKQTWEDKDLEVTIIPTYDTDVLGYWVAENEELLSKNKIDLSPSASRCTINLQDHETSCSAYRLEF